MQESVKIITYVPESHTAVLLQAMGKAGAGEIGKYTFCSFTTKGIGRFLPGEGAHPAIGAVGNLEEVGEDRIEVTCAKEKLNDVLSAIRAAHPYEEVVIDIYPLQND